MTALQAFSDALTRQLSGVNSRLQRSVVVVQDGQRGAGAGVIWRKGGYIVTNHHVVAGGKPRVSLPDGSQLPARLVAQDPEIDLALLQVEKSDLPPVPVADSRRLRGRAGCPCRRDTPGDSAASSPAASSPLWERLPRADRVAACPSSARM